MNKEELLTFCISGCGNNMHIECALRWINHKTSEGQKISCPLCRSEWSPKFYNFLEKQAKENRKRALLLKQKKLREETKKKETQEVQEECKIIETALIPNFEIEGNGMTINPVIFHNVREERKRPINANELYNKKPPRDFKVRKIHGKIKPGINKNISVPNPLESLLISGFHLGGSDVMNSNVNQILPLPRTRATSKQIPQGYNFGITQGRSGLTGSKIRYRRITNDENLG